MKRFSRGREACTAERARISDQFISTSESQRAENFWHATVYIGHEPHLRICSNSDHYCFIDSEHYPMDIKR
jgi:hypothetical protein